MGESRSTTTQTNPRGGHAELVGPIMLGRQLLVLSCCASAAATAVAATSSAVAVSRAPPPGAELYAFDAVGFAKGIPGMVKGQLRTFRTGVSGMWRNYKEAGAIRKRVKQTGVPATYPELVLLRKSGEDQGKFLQAGVLWLAAPELLPALLYFFPRSIPSTFEGEAGRAKRYATMSRLRAKALLEILTFIEDQAGKQMARPRKMAEAKLHAALATQVSQMAAAARCGAGMGGGIVLAKGGGGTGCGKPRMTSSAPLPRPGADRRVGGGGAAAAHAVRAAARRVVQRHAAPAAEAAAQEPGARAGASAQGQLR